MLSGRLSHMMSDCSRDLECALDLPYDSRLSLSLSRKIRLSISEMKQPQVMRLCSEHFRYRHARDGSAEVLLTPGDYDIIEKVHVDEARGWLYFNASPENATQKFLYSLRLICSNPATAEILRLSRSMILTAVYNMCLGFTSAIFFYEHGMENGCI
eukprot:COSAG05_NODE_1477_length_4781_cov_6.449381_6_plen_156_part_00